MKVNWKVRWNNQTFWISLIPALALVVQTVASLFGFTIDTSDITGKILAVVDAVFSVLVILGVVVDPTTKGYNDSNRAMTYEEPWQDVLPPEADTISTDAADKTGNG